MTMDKGEGRPLDDFDADREDPQGWYFDLPSDAWKRQEEKNRLLRERVRSNEKDGGGKPPREQFVLNRPTPDPPKKRGFFGRGRKQHENERDEPARAPLEPPRSAGSAGWNGEDEDDWSTERVSFDGPPQPSQGLQLRPRDRGDRGEESPPAGDGNEAAEPSTRFVPPEPAPLRLRSRTEQDSGPRLNWDFGPGAWPDAPGQKGAGPEGESPEGEDAIFTRMQAWAERGREEQMRRFGLAPEREEGAEQPDPDTEAEEPAAFEPQRFGAGLTAVPPWQAEAEADAAGATSFDEDAEGRGWATDREESGADDLSRPGLSLLRRQRDEAGEPSEGQRSSTWDEFFGLNREAEDAEAGPGEGLLAMREWAKKGPPGDDIREIPEEFLKPFDWELADQDGTSAGEEDPFAAFRVTPGEPVVDEGREPAAAIDRADDKQLAEDLFEAFPVTSDDELDGRPSVAFGAPARASEEQGEDDPFAAFREAPPERGPDVEDDPLAGIFARQEPEEPVEPPKAKRGLLGRLFGRKQAIAPAEPAAEAPDLPTGGAWVIEPEPREGAETPDTPFEGGRLVVEETSEASTEGWGANAGTTVATDRAALAEFSVDIGVADWEPVSPGPGEAEDGPRDAPDGDDVEEGWAPEPVALDHLVADDAQDGWDPEPVELTPSSFRDAVQAALWSERAVDEPGPVASVEPVGAVEPPGAVAEEKPWWETADADEDEQVEEPAPVASVEPVQTVEPPGAVAEEKPWWETADADEDEQVEEPAPVASVEPVQTVEPEAAVADEKPWWETAVTEADDEAVDEPGPVASVEPVQAIEPTGAVAEERPWWEAADGENDEPAEEPAPVASVEPVGAVEPAGAMAEEKPWWETADADEDEAVEEPAPVASVEPLQTVEPPGAVAEERPWWETADAEGEDEVVDESAPVASAEPVQTVEPAGAVAEERPWWETADAEGEDEVVDESAPVASAEPVQTVEPAGAVAEERPWWETAADDGGAASEQAPVASVEPVQAVEPAGAVAEERPWWETADADEDEAVDEPASVASVEPAQAVEPAGAVAEDRPWWETAGADEDEPVEEPAVVASAEPVQAVEPEAAVAEEKPWWERTEAPETTAQFEQAQPPTRPERDDPWASFAARRQERLEPPVTAASEAPEAEDMWGDIAETAEQAIADPDDNDIDLAASLEEQMGAALDEPVWGRPVSPGWAEERARGFASTEEEGDVILRAFEEHAAAAEPEPDPEEVAAREAETAAALAALLGENASQIVKEAGEEPQERPFIRMGAWAPQRGAPVDDGWVPEEELSAERRRRTAPVGFEPGQLDLTPPWVSEFEESDEPAERSRSDGRLKAWVRELVETVMLAALVFLSVRASFGNFMVDGNSMYPTLENGQFLIVNKLVYSEVDVEKLSSFLPIIDPGDDPTRYVFHGPQRGDIIVLRDPRDPSTDLIKRVIGLPGETIQIENGKVYINDRLLEEPYVTTPWNDTLPKILIPADEYFVMGDNRTNSLDSRSAQVGLIAKDLIVGKATLVYLPLSEFGLAPNQKGTLTDQRPVLTTKRIGEE